MAKKYKLKAFWSKKENDVMIDFPLGVMTKSDGHWLSGIFNEGFINELKERGYDIETMKFQVTVKPQLRPDKFATLLSIENEKEKRKS
jgi:hypothetical protein